MESPMVGTFVMCLSRSIWVALTKLRLIVDEIVANDGATPLFFVVATTRATRVTAALLLEKNIFVLVESIDGVCYVLVFSKTKKRDRVTRCYAICRGFVFKSR
mmetsp:Transcript_3364/g.7680  ORF Transcript_3364/g.7680 Transcript_3364/m.7680 type:complete len:103 (+) Transcript_3364:796-1104(+)